MDDDFIYVYFVNSQGKRAILSSSKNHNYWELMGRSGFTAPEVDIFSEQMASGATVYMGKSIKPRNCSMRMVCRGQSTAERDRIFFDMLGILLDADGTGEGKLYVRRSDGATFYLNCVYSGGMNIVEEYQKLHLFTLNFYAADPCFYRTGEVIYITPNGNSGTFTVNNRSAYNTNFYMDTYPTGVLSGNITNSTTGKKLTFAQTSLTAFGHLYVYLSKYKKQIYRWYNGVQIPAANLFDWNNSDSDFCAVSGENTFTYQLTDSGTVVQGSVELRFDEITMGV